MKVTKPGSISFTESHDIVIDGWHFDVAAEDGVGVIPAVLKYLQGALQQYKDVRVSTALLESQ